MAKRKGKNTRYQKQQAENAAKSAVTQPAVMQEDTYEQGKSLAEKYPGNNILKNVLRIWRDSSPRSFMTYVPVLALFLLYSVLMFVVNMLMLIPLLEEAMLSVIRGIVVVNRLILMFGLPLMLSMMHLIYNWKTEKYYFFNSLLYILPACALYGVLEFISKLIPVLFYKGMGDVVKKYVTESLLILFVCVVVVFCLGGLAQALLAFRRNQELGKQKQAEKAEKKKKDKN